MVNLKVLDTPRVGSTLPNGALVLAVSYRDEQPQEGVVLAFAKDSIEPFVTWTLWLDSSGAQTFSGHYYAHIDAAVADYGKRVAANV